MGRVPVDPFHKPVSPAVVETSGAGARVAGRGSGVYARGRERCDDVSAVGRGSMYMARRAAPMLARGREYGRGRRAGLEIGVGIGVHRRREMARGGCSAKKASGGEKMPSEIQRRERRGCWMGFSLAFFQIYLVKLIYLGSN